MPRLLPLAVMLAISAVAGLALAQFGPQAEPAPRRSGLSFMSPALQALQTDDTQNPAMLAVQDGAQLWQQVEGPAGKACVSCHGSAERSMRGVAARYPAIVAPLGPVNLAGRINQCRQQFQGAAAWPAEHPKALALAAYVGLQSRGLPVAPPPGAAMAALQAQGQALWQQRLGQLNLACSQCHDGLAGQRLAGALIPQGHATGYPIYRLEWQGLGSLQRRLQACMTGVRAQPFDADAPEWLALEAWLAQRAAGMAVETPAVRP